MHDIKISKNLVSISHLFYVEDFLFFCITNINAVNKVMEILQCYGTTSGQSPNLGKSRLFFLKKIMKGI